MTECNEREINISQKSLIVVHEKMALVLLMGKFSGSNSPNSIREKPWKHLGIKLGIVPQRFHTITVTDSKYFSTRVQVPESQCFEGIRCHCIADFFCKSVHGKCTVTFHSSDAVVRVGPVLIEFLRTSTRTIGSVQPNL